MPPTDSIPALSGRAEHGPFYNPMVTFEGERMPLDELLKRIRMTRLQTRPVPTPPKERRDDGC